MTESLTREDLEKQLEAQARELALLRPVGKATLAWWSEGDDEPLSGAVMDLVDSGWQPPREGEETP